ncbi:class I SAM-dependent methyltransferase [Candidatus Dependentiae bacterium]|nr:class I SAM-dependent methyltransferase [Candidatus Dependentiae bacterium]
MKKCWVCGSERMCIVKSSDLREELTSEFFAITDNSYGITTELSKCNKCDFIQSTEQMNLVSHYTNLEDPAYEANRKERGMQAKKIIEKIKKYKRSGRLLDIGAGSGILVEQAIKLGFYAEGIEPSKWLQKKALEHNLPVKLGIFPNPEFTKNYDIITIIDVIEHVDDPVGLLKSVHEQLAREGIIVIVTPDVGSLMAKMLRFKWWHFRIAHVGYFNQKNLDLALQNSGFKRIMAARAKWYFSCDYLLERVKKYLPKFMRFPVPKIFNKLIIPLNLHDSLFVIYKKQEDD